jgi:hypothetical protein
VEGGSFRRFSVTEKLRKFSTLRRGGHEEYQREKDGVFKKR